MNAKPLWKSWTVWFNVLAGVYASLEAAGVIAALPAHVQAIIVIVGNLLLRLKTSQPVSLT